MMGDMLTITPTELYFLGTLLKARYIDYAYIAAMPDIQKRYEFRRQEALKALDERGIIDEDFSGNVEVDDDIAALLTPVFQGTIESRVVTPDASTNVHVRETGAVLATMGEGHICFKAADDAALVELLAAAANSGAPVTISCSKVGAGVREQTFDLQALKEGGALAEALAIMKGEYE